MTLIVLFASAVIAERRKKAGLKDDDEDMELAAA
jgi:hypothetical protein